MKVSGEDNDEEVQRRRLGEPLATVPETSDEVIEDFEHSTL